jgi:hypothetical protein
VERLALAEGRDERSAVQHVARNGRAHPREVGADLMAVRVAHVDLEQTESGAHANRAKARRRRPSAWLHRGNHSDAARIPRVRRQALLDHTAFGRGAPADDGEIPLFDSAFG